MKIEYESKKVQDQCTSLKEAKKLFGGNDGLARNLLSRVNDLEAAKTITDIIVQPRLNFHKIGKKKKDYEGYFAIDVKSHDKPWRIILRPLDENGQPYDPCNIDEIAKAVKTVEIKEVSYHYG